MTTAVRRRPTASRRYAPVSKAAVDLLTDAGRSLGVAIRATEPGERYASAHLAALRAAAALIATRAQPRRGRTGNAWVLLGRIAPDLADWAAFFQAGSAKRQLAEAGITRTIGTREADDMVRSASEFLDLVSERVVPQPHRHRAG